MKVVLKYRGKRFEVDIEKCRGVWKLFGLMFRSKNTKNLLFEFDEPTNMPIHSFFCPNFLAIWLNQDKIIDIQVVKPWKLAIRPKQEFTKLIELPINSYNSEILKFLNLS